MLLRLPSLVMQYCSDIHLEYNKSFRLSISPKPLAPYLALCGDIGNPFQDKYKNLIHRVSDNYERVYLIAGNHEYWQVRDKNHKIYRMIDVENHINDIVSKYCNVKFLNKSIDYLDCYQIIGATLWSPRNIYSEDNNRIVNNNGLPVSILDINKLYYEHKQFILDNIGCNHNKTIILTHFPPTHQLVIPKYNTDYFKKYHQLFYANDMYEYIKHPVVAWLSGHTHSVISKRINGVELGINAVYGQ